MYVANRLLHIPCRLTFVQYEVASPVIHISNDKNRGLIAAALS
jgi:hypothetical protein